VRLPLSRSLPVVGLGLTLALLAGSGRTQPAEPRPAPSDRRYAVEWRDVEVPTSWSAGDVRDVTLTVVNRGPETWPDLLHADRMTGRGAVRLTWCWRDAPRSPCRQERTELPSPLGPGQAADVTVSVKAPAAPGRYLLEIELVEELVTLFRDRGGRIWSTEALVLDAGALPTSARHAFTVAGLVLLVIGLLFWCGFGVANLLPGVRTSAAGPFLVPFVGLGALSLVGHATALLPPGTDATYVGILIAFGALDFVAWREGARLRFRRRHLPAWAAALFAVGLVAWPLLDVGYLTAFGGEIDSTVYVSRATWMREHGLLVLPPRTTTDYVNVSAHDNIQAGLRQGDQYVLAFASSVTGLRPHRLFSIWMSVFYGLMPLGAYVFARFGCRLRPRACILTAVLVAVQPLLNYVAMNSYFSQSASLGFFWATACVLARVFRARGSRAVPLAAVLLASLSTLYSVYAVLVLPVVAISACLRVLGARGARGRAVLAVAGRSALLAALTLAVCPAGWWLTAKGMRVVALASSAPELRIQGGAAVFPQPGEVFGIVSHAVVMHGLPIEWTPRAVAWPATAVAILLVVAGLRSVRGQGRMIAAAMLGLLVLAALHQRFVAIGGLGFPYGYFKISALAAPLVLALFAQGVVWAVERRRARGGIALAAVGATAALVVGTTAFRHLREAAPTLASWRLDWDALQLERVRHLLPRDEPLLVEDGTWPGRSWNLYLLRHGRQYDRSPVSFQPAPYESESTRVIRHALLVTSHVPMAPRAGEPWFDRRQHELLWTRGRYRLVRRRDGAVADLRVSLPLGAAPVRVDPDGGALSVAASGIAPTQELAALPQLLELWFDGPAPASVSLTQAGRTWTEALPAGAHPLRLPVHPVDVRLLSGAGTTLERVKALANPPRR
jgi:hypothetical protein